MSVYEIKIILGVSLSDSLEMSNSRERHLIGYRL
jgi:hypothetical protein